MYGVGTDRTLKIAPSTKRPTASAESLTHFLCPQQVVALKVIFFYYSKIRKKAEDSKELIALISNMIESSYEIVVRKETPTSSPLLLRKQRPIINYATE